MLLFQKRDTVLFFQVATMYVRKIFIRKALLNGEKRNMPDDLEITRNLDLCIHCMIQH